MRIFVRLRQMTWNFSKILAASVQGETKFARVFARTVRQVFRDEAMTLQDTAASAASGTGGNTEFISFAIGNDQYGVDIMAVREIKGWSEIVHLPKQPEYVRGVLNLRGVIVPIVDLRCRFGQGVTEVTPLHVTIVVQIEDQLVGLLADRVLDIVSFDAGAVQPVPTTASNAQIEFLSGLVMVDNAMIALIDLSHLFSTKFDRETAPSVAA
jgi:purine-binding chemotaxis protein CheW